jgi:hypothetical protein
MPELSEAAVALVRQCLKAGRVAVTPENLGLYRELARAGVMYPVSGFVSGPDAIFRFTDEGWARRNEIIGCADEAV